MAGPLRESDISPTYTVVLMAVVAVIIGSTVTVLALEYTDAIGEPAPLIAETSGDLTVHGNGTQTVTLTHEGGEAVSVEDIEVVVAVPSHSATGRLVNLPVRGTDLRPLSRYVRGDHIFATENGSVGGVLTSEYGGDRTWGVGEQIRVTLAASAVDITPSDRVAVSVVHTPTNATIADETLTPTTSETA